MVFQKHAAFSKHHLFEKRIINGLEWVFYEMINITLFRMGVDKKGSFYQFLHFKLYKRSNYPQKRSDF